MIEDNKETEIYVNSSLFAENIFKRFGFSKIRDIVEDNGIKCIPMILKRNYIDNEVTKNKRLKF